MGLKTTNYNVQSYNLTLAEAYAQITNLNIDKNGYASAIFEVQQTRNDISHSAPLETFFFHCVIDKDLPVHKQVYEAAKLEIFTNWEDDIVEDEVITPEKEEEVIEEEVTKEEITEEEVTEEEVTDEI